MSEQVCGVSVNHPYIGVALGNDSISFVLVTERLVVFSSSSFMKVLKGLIAAYYVFNIVYPKTLHPPLSFIEHFLFNIKTGALPPTVVRFISCIDKLRQNYLSVLIATVVTYPCTNYLLSIAVL